MQRSITYQNSLTTFLYVVAYILYSSIATIYPFLPPMFAVLFVLFLKALEEQNFLNLVLVSFCLLIFEANNSYILFSSLTYFYILYKLVMPKIYTSFSCANCIKVSYILLSYIGYFFFLSFLGNIFLFPLPDIDYYIIYYIVIEFFIVSIL